MCVFVVTLRTNSDYLPVIHHQLFGFYNRGEMCLLQGTQLNL
jgi:hypothetical protein